MNNACENCGAPRRAGAHSCSQCGRPYTPMPATQVPVVAARCRITGEKPNVSIVVMIAAAALCVCAGIVLLIPIAKRVVSDKGPGATTPFSQTLQPSSAPQEVSYLDQVQVIIPGGVLEHPEVLTISAVENPPQPNLTAIEPVITYDISLGNQHEFDQEIDIRVVAQ